MSDYFTNGFGVLLALWLLFSLGVLGWVLSMIFERAERLRKNGVKEISFKSEFKPMFAGAVLFMVIWFLVLVSGVIFRRW